MTLQELYMNTNKFKFGKRQKSLLVVNDFELPNWSKDDPRRFTLVIKRIFESKNVNTKLNNWIDLIFGIAQSGPEAIKFCNTYRSACYELGSEEIEELKQNGQLLGNLIEKQEMGYNPKQIFKKLHKKKENINEYLEYENTFFDTNLKLRKIQFIKINNNEYDKEKNKILFNSINDILIDIDNDYIKNTNVKNNYQGGIASLKSIMKAVNDKELADKIAFIQNATGGVLGPFDSFLLFMLLFISFTNLLFSLFSFSFPNSLIMYLFIFCLIKLNFFK